MTSKICLFTTAKRPILTIDTSAVLIIVYKNDGNTTWIDGYSDPVQFYIDKLRTESYQARMPGPISLEERCDVTNVQITRGINLDFTIIDASKDAYIRVYY